MKKASNPVVAISFALAMIFSLPTTVQADGELIVNVNTATEKQLRSLPGVDQVIAQRIMERRPYKRVNDLLRVEGIGPKNLEKIRPYVKTEGETEPS